MPMSYPEIRSPRQEVPRSRLPTRPTPRLTYASETNKVASVWRAFEESDFDGGRMLARTRSAPS
jgi:hypothetical protein